MEAIQLGISTSYRWVYGQRRPVPDFHGRDGDNDEKDATVFPTSSSSHGPHRSHLGLVMPTPDGSGRVSPDPTLSSSVPPSTPARYASPARQPSQYTVHDVSAGRRTSAGHSRSRSRSRQASVQTHPQPRSASGTGSPTQQHHPLNSGDDGLPIPSSLPTMDTEEFKERFSQSPSQSRRRFRKARRNALFSLLNRPSRLRGPSNKSVSSSTSSPTHKLFSLRRFSPSMVLENSGSVARDHLASERTFLAYVRTSLAFSSTGVALVQLFTIADLTSQSTGMPLSSATRRMQRFARPLGVTMVALALVVLGIAVYRYFLVQYALPEKNFPVARLSIAFISFVLGASVVVVFGALLGGRVSA